MTPDTRPTDEIDTFVEVDGHGVRAGGWDDQWSLKPT